MYLYNEGIRFVAMFLSKLTTPPHTYFLFSGDLNHTLYNVWWWKITFWHQEVKCVNASLKVFYSFNFSYSWSCIFRQSKRHNFSIDIKEHHFMWYPLITMSHITLKYLISAYYDHRTKDRHEVVLQISDFLLFHIASEVFKVFMGCGHTSMNLPCSLMQHETSHFLCSFFSCRMRESGLKNVESHIVHNSARCRWISLMWDHIPFFEAITL